MKTPQVTPDWSTGIYIGNGTVATASGLDRENLIDAVLDEIVNDVEKGDVTAIEEMLRSVPTKVLEGYLPEPDYDPRDEG